VTKTLISRREKTAVLKVQQANQTAGLMPAATQADQKFLFPAPPYQPGLKQIHITTWELH
jgi:hypothetical protein